MKPIWLLLIVACIFSMKVQAQSFEPEEHATFQTNRTDGRFVSSRAVAHQLMKELEPAFSFRPSMQAADFKTWQKHVRLQMEQLMKHPQLQNLPDPVCIRTEQRDGYRLEKWEAYPLPACVVPFLVLIPDNLDEKHPSPAVLCIPGWGGTKEELAGEPQLYAPDKPTKESKNSMAYQYVKAGLIAVAVDNPGSGELADLETEAKSYAYDFQTFARSLLELGWNYLGYSSYTNQHILNWMKHHPLMRKDRLIVSGFSFGTEPLMALGNLNSATL